MVSGVRIESVGFVRVLSDIFFWRTTAKIIYVLPFPYFDLSIKPHDNTHTALIPVLKSCKMNAK
jgi:hypothetical protein